MRRIWAALLFTLPACGEPTAVGGSDLRAAREADHLRLWTDESDPYYFAAFDLSIIASISWAPCTVPAQCPSVRRGEFTRVPFTSVTRDVAKLSGIMVYYHHLVPSGSGFAPDSIRALGVRF